MTIIQLVLAIAGDLRAKDYGKLVADFVQLIQLLATSKIPTPDPGVVAADMPMGATAGATSADHLADECEAFAHQHHPSAGMGAAEKINWARLVQLIVKLLPLVIGGL